MKQYNEAEIKAFDEFFNLPIWEQWYYAFVDEPSERIQEIEKQYKDCLPLIGICFYISYLKSENIKNKTLDTKFVISATGKEYKNIIKDFTVFKANLPIKYVLIYIYYEYYIPYYKCYIEAFNEANS